MTLTVRLKPDLESALEMHCAERGVTKSLVVQEVLAEYLARTELRREPAATSAAYRAFEAAGFIGAGRSDGRPADKARVREVIAQRMAAKKSRHGPA
jgi:predicted transcriptional regulator